VSPGGQFFMSPDTRRRPARPGGCRPAPPGGQRPQPGTPSSTLPARVHPPAIPSPLVLGSPLFKWNARAIWGILIAGRRCRIPLTGGRGPRPSCSSLLGPLFSAAALEPLAPLLGKGGHSVFARWREAMACRGRHDHHAGDRPHRRLVLGRAVAIEDAVDDVVAAHDIVIVSAPGAGRALAGMAQEERRCRRGSAQSSHTTTVNALQAMAEITPRARAIWSEIVNSGPLNARSTGQALPSVEQSECKRPHVIGIHVRLGRRLLRAIARARRAASIPAPGWCSP
jgi:hypothetical protein